VSQSFSVIGIIGKRDDPGVADTITRLLEFLESTRRRCIVDAETAVLLPPDCHCATLPREDIGAACDLVVVVGGDGTLLDAGRLVGPHGTPLLGVNLGRLGFMVDVLPENMAATLDEIFAGEYASEQRLLLAAYVHPADGREPIGPFHALNDVVVRNKDFARVLEFSTAMDGACISHHRADGLIVATPTGSTAYALSGGGPVLHPSLTALALVPICPHTLSDRPLVVPAHHRVEVQIGEGHTTQALFTADGQTTSTLSSGDRVVVQQADRSLTLIHPSGYDYFKILRNKLQWGRGQQNLEKG